MAKFHHHPDDVIYIRSISGDYVADLPTFEADLEALQLPAYPGLPEGYRERRYDGARHILLTRNSQFGGEEPWPWGDTILDAYSALLVRMQQRIADEEEARAVALAAERQAIEQAEAAAREAEIAARDKQNM